MEKEEKNDEKERKSTYENITKKKGFMMLRKRIQNMKTRRSRIMANVQDSLQFYGPSTLPINVFVPFPPSSSPAVFPGDSVGSGTARWESAPTWPGRLYGQSEPTPEAACSPSVPAAAVDTVAAGIEGAAVAVVVESIDESEEDMTAFVVAAG